MDYEVNVVFPYIITFIIMGVCFGVAAIIANNTLYRPDNTDISKRRLWFWLLWGLGVLLSLGINYAIASGLEYDDMTYQYFWHGCVATIIFAVAYILIGLIISKIASSKKVGTWF